MIDKPQSWLTGVVNIKDLAICENVYVLPKEIFRKKLNSLINKVNLDSLLDFLVRKMNHEKRLIYRKIRKIKDEPNIKINLKLLICLLEFLNYNESLNNKIKIIATANGAWGSLKNSLIEPRLPFNFTTEGGVRLIASIMCDGGIDSKLTPHFTSRTKTLKKKFLRNTKSVLGDVFNKRSNVDKECLHLPKITGLIFVYGMGLEFGRKVIKDPGVPEFIFNLDDKLKWAFLSQVIDEEGTIDSYSNRLCILQAVEVSKPKEKCPRLLLDVKQLFKSVGIRVVGPIFNSVYYVDGKRRERWVIRVEWKEDLQKCYKNLNLSLNYKKSNLKKVARFK